MDKDVINVDHHLLVVPGIDFPELESKDEFVVSGQWELFLDCGSLSEEFESSEELHSAADCGSLFAFLDGPAISSEVLVELP